MKKIGLVEPVIWRDTANCCRAVDPFAAHGRPTDRPCPYRSERTTEETASGCRSACPFARAHEPHHRHRREFERARQGNDRALETAAVRRSADAPGIDLRDEFLIRPTAITFRCSCRRPMARRCCWTPCWSLKAHSATRELMGSSAAMFWRTACSSTTRQLAVYARVLGTGRPISRRWKTLHRPQNPVHFPCRPMRSGLR